MTWVIFALLSALSAAGVAIFGKIGVQEIDATLATAIRAVVMAVFLIAVSFGTGKFNLIAALEARPLLFIGLSGIAGALSWLFYFLALKFGPASGVVALDRLSVVFVVIFALIFLGENFSWKAVLGAALITLGSVLIAL